MNGSAEYINVGGRRKWCATANVGGKAGSSRLKPIRNDKGLITSTMAWRGRAAEKRDVHPDLGRARLQSCHEVLRKATAL